MKAIFPHCGVLVRLGVSDIHGVGVFAGDNIRAGRTVFAADCRPLRWTRIQDLAEMALTPFQRSLYDDFAVRRDGLLGTPESFDLLSIGWYVNEPATGMKPNLISLADLTFVASCDIAEGTELTIDYSGFSASNDEV